MGHLGPTRVPDWRRRCLWGVGPELGGVGALSGEIPAAPAVWMIYLCPGDVGYAQQRDPRAPRPPPGPLPWPSTPRAHRGPKPMPFLGQSGCAGQQNHTSTRLPCPHRVPKVTAHPVPERSRAEVGERRTANPFRQKHWSPYSKYSEEARGITYFEEHNTPTSLSPGVCDGAIICPGSPPPDFSPGHQIQKRPF